jgi:hypothetical protein
VLLGSSPKHALLESPRDFEPLGTSVCFEHCFPARVVERVARLGRWLVLGVGAPLAVLHCSFNDLDETNKLHPGKHRLIDAVIEPEMDRCTAATPASDDGKCVSPSTTTRPHHGFAARRWNQVCDG